ncbi:MAG: hypothetical protein NXH75_00165 [Halobacteriovoraceae bacterium]|nr:hypothetical protein [Halobacteriovoraceae bacterium]
MTSIHDSIAIFIDGQPMAVDANLSIFENLRKRGIGEGFCSHPLLESNRHCNLCWIFDEEEQEIVRSCKVIPTLNSKYSLIHKEVVLAKKESWGALRSIHPLHCKNCQNKNLCEIRENIGQKETSSVEDSEKSYAYPYSEKVNFYPQECIECGLCLSFEEALGEMPSLKESTKHSEKIICEKTVTHNYSVNLIDLCPTGCFQEKNLSLGAEDLVLKDFCRGCDRLCETEVLFRKNFDHYSPIRQRVPRGSSYWICDEINSSYLPVNNGLPLRSIMEKKEGTWARGELPSINEKWHFVIPENLPEELWDKLTEVFKNNEFTFQISSENKWENIKGLLNENKNFIQEKKVAFIKKFDEQKLESCPQGKSYFFISPEWIKTNSVFLKTLESLKGKKIAFGGFFLPNKVTEGVNYLIPLPDFRNLTWKGLNYHKEERTNSPLLKKSNIVFFREEK